MRNKKRARWWTRDIEVAARQASSRSVGREVAGPNPGRVGAPAYYRLATPGRWLMGYAGKTALYADCADCERAEPEIAGFLASGPSPSEALLIEKPCLEENAVPRYVLGLFCGDCFRRRTAQARTNDAADLDVAAR